MTSQAEKASWPSAALGTTARTLIEGETARALTPPVSNLCVRASVPRSRGPSPACGTGAAVRVRDTQAHCWRRPRRSMVHFVASDPFSIQFIIAVPVVLFCVWHFIRRSRLELRFKPQLTVVRQHVEGTLYKFAGMLVVSYAALATWSMLTSTGIIGTENSACLNGVNIRSVFVNATARVSSYFFFFAFALLRACHPPCPFAPPHCPPTRCTG